METFLNIRKKILNIKTALNYDSYRQSSIAPVSLHKEFFASLKFKSTTHFKADVDFKASLRPKTAYNEVRKFKPETVSRSVQTEPAIVCDICGKTFGALVKHFLHGDYCKCISVPAPIVRARKSRQQRNFACKLCGRMYVSQSVLKRHVKENHGRMKCELCFQQFLHIEDLKNHMVLNHTSSKIICKICKKVSWSKEAAKRHHDQSHAVLEMTSRDALEKLDIDSEKSIKRRSPPCPKCRKTFVSLHNLERHLKRFPDHQKG